MLYPGSTPEFRVYKTLSGDAILQVRYVNIAQGYTSKWQDVPVINEKEKND